jgi:hypothetical protein
MKINMSTFEIACIALASKKEKEAGNILLKELNNKDYFKRRLALENIQKSIYWKESIPYLKDLLYDRSEYVVRTALRGILMNGIDGCKEDVELIAEIWNQDEDILNYSREILNSFALKNITILHTEDRHLFLRRKASLIFRGASQIKPKKYPKEYEDIVKRYFPDYTGNQIKDLLHRLAREGCGYSALTLSLYKKYWYNRSEFEKIFGIPMFNGYGEMTFNEMMVDFYCMTDEPGIGMTLVEAKERWKKFCRHYGINLPIKTNIKINSSDFEAESKTGDIIMLANYFTMNDIWNEPVSVRGAHYMNVKTIRSDGTFYVNSWGEDYWLKEEDIEKGVWFLKVEY